MSSREVRLGMVVVENGQERNLPLRHIQDAELIKARELAEKLIVTITETLNIREACRVNPNLVGALDGQ